MKIELLNGFTRVNPQDTANVYNLEGRRSRRMSRKNPLVRAKQVARSRQSIIDPEIMEQRKARRMARRSSRQSMMDPEIMEQRKARRMARRSRRMSAQDLSPEVREMRAERMQRKAERMKQRSLAPTGARMSKASMRANLEDRNRVGMRRMTPQKMVMSGYNIMSGFDSNYFLKDNAIYSDTELLQFPGAGLLARRLMKGKGKQKGRKRGIFRKKQQAQQMPTLQPRSAVNPITGETLEQQAPLKGKAKRQARRDARRQAREDKKSTRKQARRDARRQRRTDRQEAKRMRQAQRQENRAARVQARQDRKLAQTEARQQDNILKAQAKADAKASGDTFGQKIGDFFGSAGETAGQLLSQNPQLRNLAQDFVEDRTGIDLGDDVETRSGVDEQSFIDKYKVPIILGAVGIGAYLYTKKKK